MRILVVASSGERYSQLISRFRKVFTMQNGITGLRFRHLVLILYVFSTALRIYTPIYIPIFIIYIYTALTTLPACVVRELYNCPTGCGPSVPSISRFPIIIFPRKIAAGMIFESRCVYRLPTQRNC